ncbi:DUF2726 domain-containing protein [Deinococcus marmoris]|uniref:DUF2726 domain-containing protein n=1 Tax=Deinococcus marmoris TaxID=249408 RepID=UPI0012DD460C|nr:DUF2726 domain-containing protein [Deinococcus marmoris]
MTAVPRSEVPPQPPPVVRYAELTPGDRRVLLVLGASAGACSVDGLCLALDDTPEALQGRLRGLAALGMVEACPEGWALAEELRVRVRQDLNAAVGARLVVACAQRLRGSGLTAGERVLARLCWEVFAPHVVTTHVPLRQVLDLQGVGALLDDQDRAFLGHGSAHLDVLVEHARTGEPLLALELDGPQHRESPQRERDLRKDRILRVAGLPLLRVWTDQTEPPREGLLRTLLDWRLRGALAAPEVRGLCSPALLGAGL